MTQDPNVFPPDFPIHYVKQDQYLSGFSQNRKRAYFIGKQFQLYYQNKFEKKTPHTLKARLNLAALCFGSIWFFYRKMYLYGCLLFLVMLLIVASVEYLGIFSLILVVAYMLVSSVYANDIYKYFIDQKIKKIETTIEENLKFELKQRGGINNLAAVTASLGTLLIFVSKLFI